MTDIKFEMKYSEGYAVGSDERNSMLRDAFKELMASDKPVDWVDISTGDAMILATKHTDSQGCVSIYVTDCIVRREAMVYYKPDEETPKLIIDNG